MSVGSRNQQIDLIRGVSILLVLFHHFNIAFHLDDAFSIGSIGWEAIHAVARNGNYGVTMFFVVSGYLITSNADQRWSGLANIHAFIFYGFRAARILPCLLLLLAIVNLLALAGISIFQNHSESGAPISFWLVNLASLTFWMNVLIGRVGWVNYPLGVLWSLSVEEVFYLSFPIVCLAFRRDTRLLAFWAVIIAIGPLYRLAHQGDDGGFLFAYFACFDGIAIGCCTALLAKGRVTGRAMACLLQLAVVMVMTAIYLCRPIAETNILGVTAMALGTAVLLAIAHHYPSGPFLAQLPFLTVLGWLGRLSYELYLFHLVVLGALRTVLPQRTVRGDEKFLLLVAFLILSAALGGLIGRWYAEPANRKIRQRLMRQQAKIAA